MDPHLCCKAGRARGNVAFFAFLAGGRGILTLQLKLIQDFSFDCPSRYRSSGSIKSRSAPAPGIMEKVFKTPDLDVVPWCSS